MKKVCVCGNFAGEGMTPNEGQSIKTKCIYDALVEKYGDELVCSINTFGGIRSIGRIIINLTKALVSTNNLVMLPAGNALKLTPLVVLLNLFFHRGLHYVVIGGWLDQYINEHKLIHRCLMQFDGIYVETNTMKEQLIKQQFDNIIVLPNFRNIHILHSSTCLYNITRPYHLCTFCRVMKEKGIEDAVATVEEINNSLQKNVYTLDIFGPIEKGQEEWFEQLKKHFSENIRYKGIIDYNNAYNVLPSYFAMIFPTHFYTEGIPGTIIDAFEAGVPVIYSKWKHAKDVLNDRVGIGYEFSSAEDLKKTLQAILVNPQRIMQLRKNCLIEAKKYDTEVALNILTDRLS